MNINIKKLVRDNRYLLLLLYLPVYLIAFFTIDKIETGHFIISSELDGFIPFNEYFVIPYAIWFFWYPGCLIYFMWRSLESYMANAALNISSAGGDMPKASVKNGTKAELEEQSAIAKADFIKLCVVMFTSVTICLVIYVIWPNAVDLREPIESSNICAQAVGWIRAADTPYGVCPSIHVATITAEMMVIKDSRLKSLTVGKKLAALIVTLLIAYSTMAIKQHSIIDVITGILLAELLYMLYTRIMDVYHLYAG